MILANGVFAGTEIAMISARRSRLEALAEEGDPKAKAALALIETPDVFLSTVQIGITLIGTLAGAFGGATIVEYLAPLIARIPLPGMSRYAGSIALVVVVLGIAYLSLILGELAPKRIAMAHADSIARRMAPIMAGLAAMARPAVWLLSHSTELVLRLTGQRMQEPPPATEEEIKYLMAEGKRVGVFEGTEEELVDRVFRFADLRVGEVMRPRSEIVAIDMALSPAEVRQLALEATYSRFPVYQEDLDYVLGIAHAKDILAQGEDIDLHKILREPLFVPESQLISNTLRVFQAAHSQIAIVVDEYGGTEGVITLEDVLEQLVGEIVDEYDVEEQEIVRREDGSFLIDGMLPADELRDVLGVDELPGEDGYQFNTLAGFVISQLGRLPRTADRVVAGGYCFEIVDMDGRRVDRVLISRLPAATPAGDGCDVGAAPA